MAYSELIKNFEKIRAYMREFYVYGFKSRDEYNKKSLRSYDDERRRIESWLGKYMGFSRTVEGKNVFISIDSRTSKHNPFFNALKAKSFTDGDITLHFIIFDILYNEDNAYSLTELINIINEDYLSYFEAPLDFDESTLRKKLKEYVELGIIVSKKQGKHLIYSRAQDAQIYNGFNALDFYSEVLPCGVIGSFISDKSKEKNELFAFKHHYITSAIDSEVLCSLFLAMQSKSIVTFNNLSRSAKEPKKVRAIPLKIRISVQNGRQYLMAYVAEDNNIKIFRVDNLSNVKIEESSPRFDELREIACKMESKMWGATHNQSFVKEERLEHVEFTIKVGDNEDYVIKRLEREKRIGTIEKIDNNTYCFKADVYQSSELVPWIRTFICRIVKLSISNRSVENLFKQDLTKMYKMYGIDKEGNGNV